MSEVKKEDRQITLVDEDGKETVCNILFTFHSDEYNKNYVIFYPADQEDSDEIELSAQSYVEGEDGSGELQEIESDEEWEMIEDVLDKFEQEDEECDECDDDCECCHEHNHEQKDE
jgi:uncharacterized protein YrzB (UPF0473 family)